MHRGPPFLIMDATKLQNILSSDHIAQMAGNSPLILSMPELPDEIESTASGKMYISKRLVHKAHRVLAQKAAGNTVLDVAQVDDLVRIAKAPSESDQRISITKIASVYPHLFRNDIEYIHREFNGNPDTVIQYVMRHAAAMVPQATDIAKSIMSEAQDKDELVDTVGAKITFTKNMKQLYKNATACVKPESSQLGFYDDFVEQGVLEGLLYDGSRRALVWTNEEGDKVLDRIYPPDNSNTNQFIRDFVVKRLGFKGARYNEGAGNREYKSRKGSVGLFSVPVTLKEDTSRKSVFPYIDTLSWFMPDAKEEKFIANLKRLGERGEWSAKDILEGTGEVKGRLYNAEPTPETEEIEPGGIQESAALFICVANKTARPKLYQTARCFFSGQIIKNSYIRDGLAEEIDGKWCVCNEAKKRGYDKITRNGKSFWARPDQIIKFNGQSYLKEEMVEITLGPSIGTMLPKELTMEVISTNGDKVISVLDVQNLAEKDGTSKTEAVIKMVMK